MSKDTFEKALKNYAKKAEKISLFLAQESYSQQLAKKYPEVKLAKKPKADTNRFSDEETIEYGKLTVAKVNAEKRVKKIYEEDNSTDADLAYAEKQIADLQNKIDYKNQKIAELQQRLAEREAGQDTGSHTERLQKLQDYTAPLTTPQNNK